MLWLFGKSISISLSGSKLRVLTYSLIIFCLCFTFVTPVRSELSVCLPGFFSLGLLGGIGSLRGVGGLSGDPGGGGSGVGSLGGEAG